MKQFEKKELFHYELLKLVQHSDNLPVNDNDNHDDLLWLESLKQDLSNYDGIVSYFQKIYNNIPFGRFYVKPFGFQKMPKDIRHFLARDFYIDIDIVNCHPVILSNLFTIHNLQIPSFLFEYVKNRKMIIEKYGFKNKLDVIKLINNEICHYENSDIIEFHSVLYNSLLPLLKQTNANISIEKTSNKNGSLLSLFLQNIENDILMCMVQKCKLLKINIDVLVFDGFMIHKDFYFPNLLIMLKQEVKKKMNFDIDLISKPMNSSWIPKNLNIDNEYSQMIKSQCNDVVLESKKSLNNIISSCNNGLSEFFKTGCDCNIISSSYHLSKNGLQFVCNKCGSLKENTVLKIPFDKFPHLASYFNIIVNITNNNNSNVTNFIGSVDNMDSELDFSEICNAFDDIELNSLLLNLIDINNTESQLGLVKYLDNKKDNCFIYIGKQEKDVWYSWSDNKWFKSDIPNMSSYYYDIVKHLSVLSKKSSNKILKSVIKKVKKDMGYNVTRNNVNSMWSLYYKNESHEDLFDNNPELIGFDNGVFDLNTLSFRPFSKNDFVTMSVGYDYDINGNGFKQNIVDFFLSIIPDENDRHFLLKTLASCLFGFNKEERLSCFTGRTRNGKGVLNDLIKYSFGEYYGTAPSKFIQGETPDACSPRPDLFFLQKKRIVIVNEIDSKKSLNDTFVKNLVGNDIIPYRTLFSDRKIDFQAKFKLIVFCNQRPILESDNDSIWSKFYLLNFPVTFVDNQEQLIDNTYKLKDENLKTKIKHWKLDFMLYLLDYYKLYLQEGLKFTKNIIDATKNERLCNDIIQEIVDEYIEETNDNQFITLKDIIYIYENENGKIKSNIEKNRVKESFKNKLKNIININQRGKEYFLGYKSKQLR
jgi:phage/plasmid-associated DNA primase